MAPRNSSVYWPALDGIRCCAVLSVLAFHAQTRLRGGGIGVDIFFVLSGFLITTLLLEERSRFGSVAMRAFYGRRARRLFPPLALTIALVAVIYEVRPEIGRGAGFGWTALAVVFYVANLTRVGLGLFEHTWSLSLEEQFYILWPPILLLCLRRAWSTRRILLLVLGLATVVSVERAALWLTSRDVFSLNWRYDGLLIGCSLAIALNAPPSGAILRRLSAPLFVPVLAAAVLLAYALTITPPSSVNFLGGLTLVSIATGALILHTISAERSPITTVLSLSPIVWVGRRSYGIYLYHLPILVFVRSFGWPFWSTVFVATAATLVVAACSYRWVETYFLRGKRYHDGRHQRLPAVVVPTADV